MSGSITQLQEETFIKEKNLVNYVKSVEKWRDGIIPRLRVCINEKKYMRLNAFLGGCGFCRIFRDVFKEDESCLRCPLYPEYCSNDRDAHPKNLFWRIIDAIEINDYPIALKLSEEMLTAIESFKHLWDEARE